MKRAKQRGPERVSPEQHEGHKQVRQARLTGGYKFTFLPFCCLCRSTESCAVARLLETCTQACSKPFPEAPMPTAPTRTLVSVSYLHLTVTSSQNSREQLNVPPLPDVLAS